MTEINTEKSRWPIPVRALAAALVAALFCSLVLPSVAAMRRSGDRQIRQEQQEQTQNPAEQYELLADAAISQELYPQAAEYLEKALEQGQGLEAEALSRLYLKTASV